MVDQSLQPQRKKGRATPPYVPYSTFRNFLDKISKRVPAQIDHSVMPRTSRAMRFHLAAALRYLGLITADGSQTEALLRLARAQGAERMKVLSEIIKGAYPYLFGAFDLGSCTTTQLGQEFSRRGSSGDTVRKCVAFLVAACKDAGIEVSPHVKPFSEPAGGGQKTSGSPTTSWQASLLSKFPNFDPAWPDQVKAGWFDDFAKLMELVSRGRGRA